jgi:hypothetical protein
MEMLIRGMIESGQGGPITSQGKGGSRSLEKRGGHQGGSVVVEEELGLKNGSSLNNRNTILTTVSVVVVMAISGLVLMLVGVIDLLKSLFSFSSVLPHV